jgi:virulence factor
VVVIGLGFIADEAHMRVLLARPDVEIVGIQDRDPACLAKYPYLPGYGDLDDMLEATRPDVAYILTPATTHEQIAERLFERGISVFCEKPLAADLDAATRIVVSSERYAGRLFVGFNRRYAPAVTLARQRLTGPPSFGVFQKHRPALGHRPSLENLIHLVDLTRVFFGECTDVRALAQFDDPFKERGLSATLTFVGGGIAMVAATYGECGQWTERVELYGAGQTIMIDAPNSVSVIDNNTAHVASQNPLSGGMDDAASKFGFEAETSHFLDYTRTKYYPHPAARDALATQALMTKIFAASGLPTAELAPSA